MLAEVSNLRSPQLKKAANGLLLKEFQSVFRIDCT